MRRPNETAAFGPRSPSCYSLGMNKYRAAVFLVVFLLVIVLGLVGIGAPEASAWTWGPDDQLGLVDVGGAAWYLRNVNEPGAADVEFPYGVAGWIPVAGDWDGDGIDTPGLFDPVTATWYLRNSATDGVADVTFAFGPAGTNWVPIVGDWDGNGTDTIGLYDTWNAIFHLRNTNSSGVADVGFGYGPIGRDWLPVTGDWDADGADSIGLYNPNDGGWHLKNVNVAGPPDIVLTYGAGNWLPITGQWNPAGGHGIGLYDPATALVYLRGELTSGFATTVFTYGPAGANWRPLAGNWNGSKSIIGPAGFALEMAWISPGTFLMGSPVEEIGHRTNETQHQVTLTSGFWIGVTEVTQGQWQAVMGSNPANFKNCGLDCPVEMVSWNDICGGDTGATCAAGSFIGELNTFVGSSALRLPTEAEWEYSARAGTTTAWHWGEPPDSGCDVLTCGCCPPAYPYVWYCCTASGWTHPVRSKLPNPWGLYGVAGNVWEWAADWYQDDLGTAAVVDPTGPASGTDRVMHGGGWGSRLTYVRSARRYGGFPLYNDDEVGFRLARMQ